MTRAREIVLVILTTAIIFFAFQNFDTVEVAFLVWGFKVPLALIALVPFLAGLLMGVGGTAVMFRRRRRSADAPELPDEVSETATSPTDSLKDEEEIPK